MSETPRDHFNLDAATEFRAQVRRARSSLRNLARAASASDASLPKKWRGLVTREHVLQAAAAMFGPSPQSNRLSHPSGHSTVFISYAGQDAEFVAEFALTLKKHGVRSLFLAEKSIEPPTEWFDKIWEAMHACRVVLAVVTPAFIKSDWCKYETGAALVLKRDIVPALRGVRRGPRVLQRFQSVRLETDAQQKALTQILKKACSR